MSASGFSNFRGEGHRRAHAWLRFSGVRVARRRVVRAMRVNGLLAPTRGGCRVVAEFRRSSRGYGVAARFMRTRKEQLLWVQDFETVEDLRRELLAFRKRYIEHWRLGRHGYASPAEARRRLFWPRSGGGITSNPCLKNWVRYMYSYGPAAIRTRLSSRG
jgi:transposase InsO family protein